MIEMKYILVIFSFFIYVSETFHVIKVSIDKVKSHSITNERFRISQTKQFSRQNDVDLTSSLNNALIKILHDGSTFLFTPHLILDYNYNVAQIFTFIATTLVISAKIQSYDPEENVQPYGISDVYDPVKSGNYFRTRPLVVLRRALEIGLKSSKFGFQLYSEYSKNMTDPIIELKLAEELTELLNDLGPTCK